MAQSDFLLFLNDHGLIFMFVVVFMEYLNFPGFPAGVIFPAVGFWSSASGTSFVYALCISIVAGLMGSMILYSVGRYGGAPMLHKLYLKFPKIAHKISPFEEKLRTRATTTVFLAKLIPVVRTLIGFPAGAIHMSLPKYLLFSGFGIAIWNGVLMLSGTALGSFFI